MKNAISFVGNFLLSLVLVSAIVAVVTLAGAGVFMLLTGRA